MTVESRNPTNDDTLLGVFKEVLKKNLQRTDDMLPASVVAYDRAQNRAQVRPLIQMVDTLGNPHNRAPLASVPVLLLGGGDFFCSFHLPPGSLGWIKASDRDISIFLQNYVNASPNTARLHSFEDAIFIPDLMTRYTIAGEDQQAAVIQNRTGTVKISMTSQRININAPAVNITASGAVAIRSASLTHNGVNVGSTHVHSQSPDSANNSQQNTNPPQ